MILITYLKHSVICISNENNDGYNVKTSENDVKYSSFNMKEMEKSRELNSREGDNSSRFEGKTVPWEHTIHVHDILNVYRMLYVVDCNSLIQYSEKR